MVALVRAGNPPGPKGNWLVGSFFSFVKDPLNFLVETARDHGDICSYRFAYQTVWQVNSPELVEEVLLKQARFMIKDEVTRDLESVLGQGLLTSSGDLWKRQRKLAAPPLQKKQIQQYAACMVEETHGMVDKMAEGPVDIHEHMVRLTLEIVGRTLFDTRFEDTAAKEAGVALTGVMDGFMLLIQTWRRLVPSWVPLPARIRYQRAGRAIDDFVNSVIQQRRASGTDGDDLLSRLMRARDDDGHGMTDKQLRDEVVTMVLAGHETTALALTYAIYLLGRHPDVLARLNQEIQTAVGGRDATPADMGNLPYTDAVLKETMRLYPPAWAIGREPTEDVQIGGYTIPKGGQIFLSQWAVHRNADIYEDPLAFKPERWLDGLADRLPRFAYFPFGGGPRICIGNHFAIMEAMLILVTFLQRVSFTYEGPETLPLQASVTVRPAAAVIIRAERR